MYEICCLENCIGTDDWPCRYNRCSFCYVYRTKQCRKIRAIRGNSLYQTMYNAVEEVSHQSRTSYASSVTRMFSVVPMLQIEQGR